MHLVYGIDHVGSGGAQRQVVELAAHLQGERHLRVSILAYGEQDFLAERLRTANVPIVVVRKRTKIDPGLPFRIRRWLRDQRADVVHAFMPWPAFWFYLAVRGMSPAERPRFIAAERSSLAAAPLLMRLGQSLSYRGSDAMTANSECEAAEIERRFGIARERIHYLPNGIDLAEWDRAASAECPLPLEQGAFNLALVGGLRPEKNHELVLAALDRLGPERTRGWRVWFIGPASGGRATARSIREQIARRGLGEMVRIEPSTPQIAAVISRLDGVLLPSDFEGFPNVALEAMASRVPVIATAVGDVPNLIEDGETGFLLPRLDVESLARAMQHLHDLGAERRAAIGTRARAVVERSYDMPDVARRYLALYRALATERPRADPDGT